AGLLQIFLGGWGIGRFYLGSTSIAVTQLVLTVIGIVTSIILIGFVILIGVGIWALVDGIMILTGSVRDPQGRPLRP
ncbi:TM2 domain-containing protein, partial [Tsukamurella tyrosinosolvens]